MFTGRTLFLFVTALFMAIGAVLIAKRWVESMKVAPPPVQQSQYSRIVVAAQDIPQWQKVEESQVKEVNWPKDAVTSDMFAEKSKVLGKIAIDAIYSGEPLNARRVVDPKEGSVFSLRVSANKRAFTVRVNDVSGVGGFLLPDNHVDVLASRKLPGSNDETLTETIVQNIKILAVDQNSPDDKNKPVVVHSVTLEMTPQQAELVFKADGEGSIQLALRNPADKNVAWKTETSTRPPSPPPTRPGALAPAGKPYSIIRGSHSSQGNCGRFACTEQVK